MITREEKNKDIQELVDEERNHEIRKKIIKTIFKLTLFLIVFFSLFYLYTKYATTIGLIVKEKRISDEKIPDSFNGVKIVHFTDTYYGTTITLDEINNLVKEINKRNPDIVIFTGNLIEKDYQLNTKKQEKLIKSLQKINASIEKYAVYGKNDKKGVFSTIMNQSNFIVLDNSYDLIYNNNTPILITGLSSYVKNNRNVDEAFKYFKEETHNSNIYTISIMSETEDLDEIITNYNPDLVLAGNSLNGEVKLPILGGIIKQKGSSKYINEYYKVATTDIYISSGLASPTLGFRILNSPSFNFYRLSNKK